MKGGHRNCQAYRIAGFADILLVCALPKVLHEAVEILLSGKPKAHKYRLTLYMPDYQRSCQTKHRGKPKIVGPRSRLQAGKEEIAPAEKTIAYLK